MASGTLTLIGTAHQDPRGPVRLEKLLQHLQPDLLAVECSDVLIEGYEGFRQRLQETLQAHRVAPLLGERFATTLFSQLFYEWYVTESYAKAHHIPLAKVDSPELPRELWLKDRKDMTRAMDQLAEALTSLSSEDCNLFLMEALGKLGRAAETMGWRKRFAYWMLYKPYVAKQFMIRRKTYVLCEFRQRDPYMATQLRELCAAHPGKHLVHVGGLGHVLDLTDVNPQMQTLRTLLPEAQVRLLSDADAL